MTRIESEEQLINSSTQEIYDFLCDMRNYGQLMPEMVSDYQAEEKTADFAISGLGKIHVEINDQKPNELINLKPSGKLPFKFDLAWEIKSTPNGCSVKAVANADLNMFMKMMAEPKLKEFVSEQARTLKNHFNS